MPIYEYQCNTCHQVTEAWQSLADPPLTTCDTCSGDLKKLISMSSFQLKGGGWYADGYSASSPAAKPCAASESCPAAKSDSPASSGSESKPACGQGACCNV